MTDRSDQEIAREQMNAAIALSGLGLTMLGLTIVLWLSIFNLSNGWRLFGALACAALCYLGFVYAALFQGATRNSSHVSSTQYGSMIFWATVILTLTGLADLVLAGRCGYLLFFS